MARAAVATKTHTPTIPHVDHGERQPPIPTLTLTHIRIMALSINRSQVFEFFNESADQLDSKQRQLQAERTEAEKVARQAESELAKYESMHGAGSNQQSNDVTVQLATTAEANGNPLVLRVSYMVRCPPLLALATVSHAMCMPTCWYTDERISASTYYGRRGWVGMCCWCIHVHPSCHALVWMTCRHNPTL